MFDKGNLAYPVSDNGAHMGGAVVGIGLSFLFSDTEELSLLQNGNPWHSWLIILFFGYLIFRFLTNF